jgi:hypothetical protein
VTMMIIIFWEMIIIIMRQDWNCEDKAEPGKKNGEAE